MAQVLDVSNNSLNDLPSELGRCTALNSLLTAGGGKGGFFDFVLFDWLVCLLSQSAVRNQPYCACNNFVFCSIGAHVQEISCEKSIERF